MSHPLIVWDFMYSNSSLSSLPGLRSTLSFIVILPISCSANAATIMLIFSGVRLYSGYLCAAFSASILVNPLTRLICSPLSRLRYSTTVPSISIIFSLLSFNLAACCSNSLFCLLRFSAWIFTLFSRLSLYINKSTTFCTLFLTVKLSKGFLKNLIRL